jgi:WD40 repeat protein
MRPSMDGKRLFVSYVGGENGGQFGDDYSEGEDDVGSIIFGLDTPGNVCLEGHTAPVTRIVQGKGDDVLTCSYDKTIRRWKGSTGECAEIYRGHTGFISSILYDEATDRIFSYSICDDPAMSVWDYETARRIRIIGLPNACESHIKRVADTTIAVYAGKNTIELYDTVSLRRIHTVVSDHEIETSFAVTPDGQCLVVMSNANVEVISVATGLCMYRFSCIPYTGVYDDDEWRDPVIDEVDISEDGQFIITGGYWSHGNVFKVSPPFPFAIHTGRLIYDWKHEPFTLFSDGAIRLHGDWIAMATYTSTCSPMVKTAQFILANDADDITFNAPDTGAMYAWTEAIRAVINDLAYHSDNPATSAEEMLVRYRFDLLQTILVHRRDRTTMQWRIPREIVQVIGRYCAGKK